VKPQYLNPFAAHILFEFGRLSFVDAHSAANFTARARYHVRVPGTPMPFTCTIREHIAATPEVVFNAASDFAAAPTRIPGITKVEMITSGPTRLGTKFRESRMMFGKEATETMEVIDFRPGHSYTLRADSGGCEYKTIVSVQPLSTSNRSSPSTAPGTEVTFDFSAAPYTFGARLASAIFGWMMRGACTKMIKQDLISLKQSLETS
jgi:carbon monoxide dehydrogenase subunit G